MHHDQCVYIVDDDEAVRDSLSVLLESKGYAIKSFVSAPEFLAASPTLPVGCLIVDIRMPEMDGLELQQHLTDRSLDFPLIVITGHGDVPLAVRAMKAGAVDFIEKPFASETILSSLEAALSRLATPSEEDPAKAAAKPRRRFCVQFSIGQNDCAKAVHFLRTGIVNKYRVLQVEIIYQKVPLLFFYHCQLVFHCPIPAFSFLFPTPESGPGREKNGQLCRFPVSTVSTNDGRGAMPLRL